MPFLASVQIVGVQGLTEQILDAKYDVPPGQDMEVKKSGKLLILSNDAVIAVKTTNFSDESGNYATVIKKEMENEARNFLAAACLFLISKAPNENKHKTHPEIRRSSQYRWQTQIQVYADTLTHAPNAKKASQCTEQQNHTTEQPRKLHKSSTERQTEEQSEQNTSRPSQAPAQGKQVDMEQKLKEIKERLTKKIDGRLALLEEKYNEVEAKLTKTLESMDKMTQCFEKCEDRISEQQNKEMAIVEDKLKKNRTGYWPQSKDKSKTPIPGNTMQC